ncbi:MAG: class IV adenylate cyclase [Planctomycetota bacterium]|nr:class IV adenylate cyclase [Planctomycetota bacterium]
MTLEVELKFAVKDVARIQSELASLSAQPGPEITQVDRYFQHPSRNFKETNEALRIRCSGEDNRVTYKGPVVDRAVKAREEIEIPFAKGTASTEQFAGLLTNLGFQEARSVRKRRVSFQLTWESRGMEVVLDDVDGLGTFVEIETIAETADLDGARTAVLSLAERLQLRDVERRSYLTMLLQADAANA